jgi:hypothetical protein
MLFTEILRLIAELRLPPERQRDVRPVAIGCSKNLGRGAP